MKREDIMYHADETRDEGMQYNRCGKSGLKLPLVSMGLWHNFGSNADFESMKNIYAILDNDLSDFENNRLKQEKVLKNQKII